MGIVPYIQSGESIPNAEAGIIPHIPIFRFPSEDILSWICFLRKTDIREPVKENLPELQVKIIPDINKFPVKCFNHSSTSIPVFEKLSLQPSLSFTHQD